MLQRYREVRFQPYAELLAIILQVVSRCVANIFDRIFGLLLYFSQFLGIILMIPLHDCKTHSTADRWQVGGVLLSAGGIPADHRGATQNLREDGRITLTFSDGPIV